MKLLIDPRSSSAIYDQIKTQIIQNIFNNVLIEDEQLESIRVLAKQLKVAIITVKRAYDDLILEGYLYSRPGIGVFVSKIDKHKIKELQRDKFHESVTSLFLYGESLSLKKDEMKEIIFDVMKEN